MIKQGLFVLFYVILYCTALQFYRNSTIILFFHPESKHKSVIVFKQMQDVPDKTLYKFKKLIWPYYTVQFTEVFANKHTVVAFADFVIRRPVVHSNKT